MKFCEKCGAQINDEATICPQCQTPTNNQPVNVIQQPQPKKKSVKMYFIIPLIIVFTALITFLVMYFVLPNNSKSEDNFNSNSSTNNSSTDATFATTTTDECPEDEHGHHSWQAATCTRPSYCWNCGAYKDDKLGNHDFELEEDTGLIECYYCHMIYDD